MANFTYSPYYNPNRDQERLYQDPSFRAKIENYAGQGNPYDINASNPVERKRAFDWLQNQENFMKEGRPPALDWKKVPQAVQNGQLADLYKLDAYKIANPDLVKFNDLTQDLQGNINQANLNKEALAELRSRGLSTGPSPWLSLQLEGQKRDEQNQVNNATAQLAGADAQARTQLAMRGGLMSGARERLARSGVMSSNATRQNIANAGASARLGLQTTDESNKLDILKALPGLEATAAGFDLTKANSLNDVAMKQQQTGIDTGFKNNQQTIDVSKYNADQSSAADKFNSQAALNELLQQRAFEANKYNEAMKAWGAEKTAQATGGGGGKK